MAVELGQEARDGLEEEEGDDVADWQKLFNTPSRPRPTRPPAASLSKGKQKDEEENKDVLLTNALRPTREWYMLLAGLLTRAVLEGYLSAGWRGTKPVECLLLVGIQSGNGRLLGARTRTGDRGRIEEGAGGASEQGRVDRIDDDDEEAAGDEEEFRELDPDGLPSLGQALRVLFPSLRTDEASLRSFPPPSLQQPSAPLTRRLGQAEAEYELEMFNRLRHVSDFSSFYFNELLKCYSFMISLNRRRIYRLIWKIWRGLIRRNLLNVLLLDFVRLLRGGEGNQSWKQ